jgi:plastocyanin
VPTPTDSNRRESGFTQLAAAIAVLISIAALLAVAFKLESGHSGEQVATAATDVAAPAPSAEGIKLVVKSDEEKGKIGSDGNWHDAFLPADFKVEAGATVQVTVYNYDDMPHTFTAPGLGVNTTIAAGAEEKAGKTTFTIHAPQKAGSYEWFCALPCDPWAMAHFGFMKGHVTVA